MNLALSKHQLRTLAGLSQPPDQQRIQKIFLDLLAGRAIETALCPICDQEFTRQSEDLSLCCSSECAHKHAYTENKKATDVANEAMRAKLMARHGRVF